MADMFDINIMSIESSDAKCHLTVLALVLETD